jgi:hypothetical protein
MPAPAGRSRNLPTDLGEKAVPPYNLTVCEGLREFESMTPSGQALLPFRI